MSVTTLCEVVGYEHIRFDWKKSMYDTRKYKYYTEKITSSSEGSVVMIANSNK